MMMMMIFLVDHGTNSGNVVDGNGWLGMVANGNGNVHRGVVVITMLT